MNHKDKMKVSKRQRLHVMEWNKKVYKKESPLHISITLKTKRASINTLLLSFVPTLIGVPFPKKSSNVQF